MSDWLEYDWEWEQQPISVKVDMQYWQLLPTLADSHLVYIACAPRDPEARGFNRAESRALGQLFDTLQRELEGEAIYVGAIETEALHQFYFYTANPALITRAAELCSTQPKLLTTYGEVHEPTYATYYRFLFPDDAKLQSVENAAHIRDVARHGGDLNLVRRITMMLVFPTFEGRETFIRQLPEIGLSVGVTETREHKTHPFCVTVYGYSTLHLMDLNRCTARAIRAAAPQDGILEEIDSEFIEKH